MSFGTAITSAAPPKILQNVRSFIQKVLGVRITQKKTVQDIPIHTHISRGWDHTNSMWRGYQILLIGELGLQTGYATSIYRDTYSHSTGRLRMVAHVDACRASLSLIRPLSVWRRDHGWGSKSVYHQVIQAGFQPIPPYVQ